ncbi:MAG: hypothetical protein J6A75_11700 [Lachnospiraceae bacterium]|nr:hypothetical protein [Lachnospiraceae bacterium]
MICPFCGCEVTDKNMGFCANCGSVLDAQNMFPSKPKKNPMKIVLGILIGVLILVLALCVILIIKNVSDENSADRKAFEETLTVLEEKGVYKETMELLEDIVKVDESEILIEYIEKYIEEIERHGYENVYVSTYVAKEDMVSESVLEEASAEEEPVHDSQTLDEPTEDGTAEDTSVVKEVNYYFEREGPIGVAVVWNESSGGELDKALKDLFENEEVYEASFAYAQDNETLLMAAKKYIQDGIDYLLISAEKDSEWEVLLQDAQAAGTEVILLDRVISDDEDLYTTIIYTDTDKSAVGKYVEEVIMQREKNASIDKEICY